MFKPTNKTAYHQLAYTLGKYDYDQLAYTLGKYDYDQLYINYYKVV